MNRDPIAQDVARELEALAKGGAHDAGGPRATFHLYSLTEQVRRAAEVVPAYLERDPDVGRDGQAAIVTAGPPGAGKTTALESAGLLSGSFRNIDADVVKDMLIERALHDGIFNDLLSRRLADGRPVRPRELAGLVHHESTAITHNLTQLCARRGENILVQGTLAWDQQPRVLLNMLEESEYASLTIVDVEVNLALALERALDRWWLGRVDASDPMGGRFTPSHVIEGLYLPDGSTKCRTNAEFMLAMSGQIPATLRVLSTDGDISTEVVKMRAGGLDATG
ncbi:zeta toxin family protein [Microbacterium ureisolvens]|uniref:UDP-N-acetylglucosamine kinase n=1 Tax=Microbacterium ureisolvens TaxID=2781186 RepID=A0ABS7HZY3_9MICO|nr:zeta toxin family protein [Microbacterium ureisolvens]MBW9110643.1 zeta toxin family protein [Microbacterium ureisolvens]